MAIELVTFDQLKALLDLESSTISGYPALSLIRDSVTTAIEEYVGRELEKIERSATVFVNETPTAMVQLKGIPVESVSSVTITRAGITETVDTGSYNITSYGIKLIYQKISDAKVDVVYTGGISATTNAFNRAALLQTAYEYQSKEQIGAEMVSSEGGMVSRPALQLLAHVRKLLKGSLHPLMITGGK